MDDSPIGRLPAELRNKIYHYVFTTNEPLIVQVYGRPASTSHISLARRHLENKQGDRVEYPHALALTCRHAYLEAMSVFYTVVELGINVIPLAKTTDWNDWVVLRTFEALKHVTTTINPRHLCCVQSLTIYLRAMVNESNGKLILMILANVLKPSTIIVDIGWVITYCFRRPFVAIIVSLAINFRELQRILSQIYRAPQGSPKCKLILSIDSFWKRNTQNIRSDGTRGGLLFIGAGLRIDTNQAIEEAHRLERMGLEEPDEDMAETYKFLVWWLRSI